MFLRAIASPSARMNDPSERFGISRRTVLISARAAIRGVGETGQSRNEGFAVRSSLSVVAKQRQRIVMIAQSSSRPAAASWSTAISLQKAAPLVGEKGGLKRTARERVSKQLPDDHRASAPNGQMHSKCAADERQEALRTRSQYVTVSDPERTTPQRRIRPSAAQIERLIRDGPQ
jgi:hypothetical protein